MFNKVLVANRGAIARRVVRACNELGVASVAIYAQSDSGAPYLAEASQTYALAGQTAAETYLNQEAILRALHETGADALHPGYGFLSENAEFAAKVMAQDVHFIGPDPKWLATMGDKVAARNIVERAGFPLFKGSDTLADLAQAQAAAAQVGFPLMLKPAGGGGGIGMQVVTNMVQLQRAFGQSQRMAEAAFGTGELFLEAFIAPARHVEIQLLGDERGNVMHLYERDCSLQRRQQKVIEESPAPGVQRAELETLATQSARLGGELGYNNLGTLETLRSPAGEYGFLEMNTRIQVEHGVTEMVTGLDLVQQQICLAAGGELPERPPLNGHAVQARVYAEDSRRLFPSTGKLQAFEPPQMTHIRVETGYAQGMQVTPYFDPMLAKVISWAPTRELAIGRLRIALKAFTIRGVRTNLSLLQGLLADEGFLAGQVHTGYIGDYLARSP